MAKKELVIYQAKESFWVGDKFVKLGDTIVSGHPLLKGRTKLFELFKPTYGTIGTPETETEPETEGGDA